MRDDLGEAQAAVDWAEAQIDVMQERFIGWQRSGPYELGIEPDTKSESKFLVARHRSPLHSHIQIDTGMVIHAIRSSLHILMGALAARHGKAAGKHPSFPVRRTEAKWDEDVAKDIESKGWLSSTEVAMIKSAGPYPGTDNLLFTLHHLDITSKHRRLLKVTPTAIINWLAIAGQGVQPYSRLLHDRTILYRLDPGLSFNPTDGNTRIISKVSIDEPDIGIKDEEAFALLRRYVAKAYGVIALFDGAACLK